MLSRKGVSALICGRAGTLLKTGVPVNVPLRFPPPFRLVAPLNVLVLVKVFAALEAKLWFAVNRILAP